jgi:hypothetical protein
MCVYVCACVCVCVRVYVCVRVRMCECICIHTHHTHTHKAPDKGKTWSSRERCLMKTHCALLAQGGHPSTMPLQLRV